jgi:anti-sigma28 factor (negative regulator of flagellin synthesis)
MSIQIYNDGLAGAGASETSRAQDVSRAASLSPGSTSASSSSGEDQVQISSLSSALSAQGSQREAHVAQLAAAYQSGRYEVNAMDVSKALVNQALKAGGAEGEQ